MCYNMDGGYMLIRKAKLEDCSKIDNLLTLLIRDEKQYDDSIDSFFTVIGYYENFVNDPNRCLLVAENNDEIIGYIYGFKQEQDPTSSKIEYLLDALYVKEEYRKQEVASLLIQEFKKWCKEKKATCINVNVNSQNTKAKNLYQKENFVTVKETMSTEL